MSVDWFGMGLPPQRVGAIYTMGGPDGTSFRTELPTTGDNMFACSAAALDVNSRVSHCAYVFYADTESDASITAWRQCHALFPASQGWRDHSVALTMVLLPH